MEDFTIFRIAYLVDNNVLSDKAKELIKKNVSPEMLDADGPSAQYCIEAIHDFFEDNLTVFSEQDVDFLQKVFSENINYLEF
jgi:hypothetical protein